MTVKTSNCTVVRPGATYAGRQGLTYAAGISNENTGAQALCLHRLSLPPGGRAVAHLHADHESAIYVISGTGEFWWGEQLEHHEVVEAGDFIHIPAGVPHLPANLGDDDARSRDRAHGPERAGERRDTPRARFAPAPAAARLTDDLGARGDRTRRDDLGVGAGGRHRVGRGQRAVVEARHRAELADRHLVEVERLQAE